MTTSSISMKNTKVYWRKKNQDPLCPPLISLYLVVSDILDDPIFLMTTLLNKKTHLKNILFSSKYWLFQTEVSILVSPDDLAYPDETPDVHNVGVLY